MHSLRSSALSLWLGPYAFMFLAADRTFVTLARHQAAKCSETLKQSATLAPDFALTPWPARRGADDA